MWISLTEEMQAKPRKGFEDWKVYRIEYADSDIEGILWLPPHVNPDKIANYLYEEINQ